MNKKETSTILNTYKEILKIHEIIKIDKEDTIREFKFMLDKLDLKKERYIIENEVIAERDNLKFRQKEMYKMIFEMFLKYDVFVHYDLKEVNDFYEDLQYKFTDEENGCHIARINIIMQEVA